jgi:hypothetical protein
MVDVKYSPIKELIIYEAYKMPINDIVLRRVRQNSVPPLMWCDGILYFYVTNADSEVFDSEFTSGKFHWLEVYYAEMPIFKPVIEVDSAQFGGIKMNVIDNSMMPLHKSFAAWAKKRG